ncbi:SKP1/BTB/POZ domain-containing protein [Orpheovirus IHUMI-LCC2]|uniref:SKP1/BTB/POZ domain-containing protein n=1 Tax=Orpheovirus IHUMI-LCC2 TaxID=2023057 RepID=A0A2I2L527_9VIRU|nr:SKP1/BTB/POZ domain-containing protein [Orpheovirus IHUMI-LCC2]SNW62610.1 SKP1/BTB/POZ domain-containing protein [Orpheovirus IHUMI-LCC2]
MNNTLKMFRKFYNNKLFSDVIIKCKNSEDKWYAHKIILCDNSDFMYKKFTLDTKDKHEDIIYVDCDSVIIECILKFLYNVEINISKYSLQTKMDIYEFADYWGVKSVNKFIKEHISKMIRKSFSEVDFDTLCQYYVYNDIKSLIREYVYNMDISSFYFPDFFDIKDVTSVLEKLKYKTTGCYERYVALKEWQMESKTDIKDLVIKYIDIENFSFQELKDADINLYIDKDVLKKHMTKKQKIQYVIDNDHLRCEYVGQFIGQCTSLKSQGYSFCTKHVKYLQKQAKMLS